VNPALAEDDWQAHQLEGASNRPTAQGLGIPYDKLFDPKNDSPLYRD
jgi:hypothetical protein